MYLLYQPNNIDIRGFIDGLCSEELFLDGNGIIIKFSNILQVELYSVALINYINIMILQAKCSGETIY